MLPALAVAMLACCGTAASADLVGRVVPPYPDGLASIEGSCIGPLDPETGCGWSLGVLSDAAGTPRFVVAERSLRRVDGMPEWYVLDAIAHPILGDSQRLVHGLCESAGDADPGIVAVVDAASDVEWYEDVQAAWGFDRDAGAFVPLDPADVRCLDEGHGYDG